MEHAEKLGKQGADIEVLKIGILKMTDEVLEVGTKIASVRLGRISFRQLDNYPAESFYIPLAHTGNEIDQLFGGFPVKLSGHAAINETERSIMLEKYVAGMWVGMEETETQALLEDGVCSFGYDCPAFGGSEAVGGEG